MIQLGIDIRVYASGSPISTKFSYDFSEYRTHIRRATEEIRYKVVLFVPKGAYYYRFKKRHNYDAVVFKGMSDLQQQAWFSGVRVVFTNDSMLLSTHRMLCRKYYPGATDELFEELKRDKGRAILYE